eukprot:TRINITY_DN199_c0_g1_i2.p1 TRINITY_DN199_c0_g1~~TRINITY_DN199_c0_g1_i2.p1  ORF type:complete len:331 (-),score=77.92 TRINITY_DN199_c0_g1_i2:34-1026(-)
MSFYVVVSHAPFDSATLWAGLGASGQQNALNYVHNAGGCVLLSVGGATDSPFTLDPTSVGNEVAKYAQANNYDGIDFDIENIQVGFVYNGVECSAWLTTVTNTARQVLGSSATITHAPQGPYFGTIGGSDWTGTTGGYSAVEKNSKIDWYNMQFYNQGPTCYFDYTTLFVTSCSTFPNTAIKQVLANTGMSANKIVVGKPITTADASNGFLSAGDFGALLNTGISNGFDIGGYMGWKWEVEATTWVSQVGIVTVASAGTTTGASAATTNPTSKVNGGAVAIGVIGGLVVIGVVVAYLNRSKISARFSNKQARPLPTTRVTSPVTDQYRSM